MKLNCVVLITCALLATSCAIADKDPGPVIPAIAQETNVYSGNSNRFLWGAWNVIIGSDRASAEIHQSRVGVMHLNVVKILESPSCYQCLTIKNIHKVGPYELEADVTLKHPFPGLAKYTGFDVRGIFIAQSDFTFPVSGRKVGIGLSVPRMLNADGFTSVFNPTEFPSTDPGPPALKYFPGKYSTGGNLSATLNPFLAYRREAPRRMFEAGGSETRKIRLYAPPGPIYFGYAVDACWHPVENVTNPLVDFPPEANCLEAYKIAVSLEDSNSSLNSSAPISVEVFDHQGLNTISSVVVEIPGLFNGTSALSFSEQTGADSFLYKGVVTNSLGATWGDYPMIVRVIDTSSDPNLGQIDAWYVGNAHVKRGWARSWAGDMAWNRANAVALDSAGNILVAGAFDGTVDLDPGLGEDVRVCEGYNDVFLSLFDTDGKFLGARTWGGTGYDEANALAIDKSGNIYILGYFTDSVDFDPGPGEEIRTATGVGNIFLSKLSANGLFLWVRTWEDDDTFFSSSISVDPSGGVYIAGSFRGSIDFDPGPGEDIHHSGVSDDAFLVKLDTNGNFQWGHSWGALGGIAGTIAYSVTTDKSGNAYVTGHYSKTVDFDPGPGEDIRVSGGYHDAFLTRFNSNGVFLGALTWGSSPGSASSRCSAISGSNIYVAGIFSGTADLDPGPGEDIHEADDPWGNVYLSKFNAIGIFQWAKSWGGPGNDRAEGIHASLSRIYVIGGFRESVDFDPGPGVDLHTAENSRFMYLTSFTPDGEFIWARSWDSGSGAINDGVIGLTSDANGVAYTCGHFMGTVDFDPTSGVDNHTAINNDFRAFLCKILPDGTW